MVHILQDGRAARPRDTSLSCTEVRKEACFMYFIKNIKKDFKQSNVNKCPKLFIEATIRKAVSLN